MQNIRKILIVDDEELMRVMLSRFFSNHNFEVFEAASSKGVVDLVEKESIRLAIIDLKLLHESGLNLGKQLMKQVPDMIRIAMTGYPTAYELKESREAGFDDYFRKPLNLEILLQRVENAVSQLERWINKV